MITRKLKREKLLLLIVIITVCFILVIFIPIPLHVNITLNGYQMTNNGKTEANVDISIKGWHLKYLFRSDEIKGSVTVTNNSSSKDNDVTYNVVGPVLDNQEGIWFTSFMSYNETENGYISGYLFFDKEFDRVMVTEYTKNKCYVATTKTAVKPNELFDFFSDIVGLNQSLLPMVY